VPAGKKALSTLSEQVEDDLDGCDTGILGGFQGFFDLLDADVMEDFPERFKSSSAEKTSGR
jgi:hypothetical protein